MSKLLNLMRHVKWRGIETAYQLNNKYSSKVGVTAKRERANPLIISMTSFPARIGFVHLTIESLMRQSLKPDHIILWLASTELTAEKLGPELTRLQKRGLDIRFVPENLKAYKKLIYSVEAHPHAVVVTADDDVLYPNWWLDRLYSAYLETPDCVMCYRGHQMALTADKKGLLKYNNWAEHKGNSPSFSLFPTGVSGVLYFPGSLDARLLDKEIFSKLCPHNDDIWFKAMSLLTKTPCRKVAVENVGFALINDSQEESLFQTNVIEEKNDPQLKAVFDHFNLYKYLSD